MSIGWRLFVSYLVVILVAVGTLGLYLGHEMSQRALTSLESSLLGQARLIGQVVGDDLARPQRRAALEATTRRLGRDLRLRITLVARDGTVLADSEHDARGMENHARRPEIRQALSKGTGQALRQSGTLGIEMLYVARREPAGVVRVAVPLEEVAAVQGRIRSVVLAAAGTAVALALLLSVLLARTTGARIGAIGRAARSLATGDLEARVRPRGRDEVAALAANFNEMAERLRVMVRELREEKQTAETMLERLGEAILVTDPAGRITVCNLAAERIFAIDSTQATGRSVVDATQNAALDEAFRQALASGGTATPEVHIHVPRERTLEATVTAIAGEEPLGAVAILHDVTELRRLEAVRREFVANASHELQTPITAIKAVTEALLGGARDDPAVAERFLRDLDRQAERLGALVRDLLDLAAIEAGPVALGPSTVGLADLAQEVASGLDSLAASRRIAVSVEVPDDLAVRTDRPALSRALSNLLDNAIKYTEPGGQAGLRATRADDTVAITVWDTGLGIASTDLPRIFERFYRVDPARSRELGGTGLGLSIVRHLVEALGGRVTVESQLGKGSEFTVTLPASGPQAGDAAPSRD